MSGTRQYTTFFAGPYHFGIGVDRIQEVVQPMVCTPVPLTSDVVDGLVNLRGQIITAVDLRARLELPRTCDERSEVSLIVRTGSGLISLRADRLGDVLDLEACSADGRRDTGSPRVDPDRHEAEEQRVVLEPVPDTVVGPVREVLVGVLQLRRTLLLILDPDQLLTAAVGLRLEEGE